MPPGYRPTTKTGEVVIGVMLMALVLNAHSVDGTVQLHAVGPRHPRIEQQAGREYPQHKEPSPHPRLQFNEPPPVENCGRQQRPQNRHRTHLDEGTCRPRNVNPEMKQEVIERRMSGTFNSSTDLIQRQWNCRESEPFIAPWFEKIEAVKQQASLDRDGA
ncbi:MAG: hypothetical protein WBQ86_13230 [Candidatus Binatus sp.]